MTFYLFWWADVKLFTVRPRTTVTTTSNYNLRPPLALHFNELVHDLLQGNEGIVRAVQSQPEHLHLEEEGMD